VRDEAAGICLVDAVALHVDWAGLRCCHSAEARLLLSFVYLEKRRDFDLAFRFFDPHFNLLLAGVALFKRCRLSSFASEATAVPQQLQIISLP
jgi:hypothetical protein